MIWRHCSGKTVNLPQLSISAHRPAILFPSLPVPVSIQVAASVGFVNSKLVVPLSWRERLFVLVFKAFFNVLPQVLRKLRISSQELC